MAHTKASTRKNSTPKPHRPHHLYLDHYLLHLDLPLHKFLPLKTPFLTISSSSETSPPHISLTLLTNVLHPLFQCILPNTSQARSHHKRKPQKTQSDNPPSKWRSMRIMVGVSTSKQSKSVDTTIYTITENESDSPPSFKLPSPSSK